MIPGLMEKNMGKKRDMNYLNQKMDLSVMSDSKPYLYLLDILVAYGIQKVVVL